MTIIILMAVMTALGALAADRLKFLKDRPVAQGVWFGVLAIVANTAGTDVTGLNIPVGLREAPVLTAGFFFGPTAGLVAGVIAAVERALTPLWGVGLGHWQLSASITLLIAGYGAALSKWIFDGKRPPVVTAAVAAAFGAILHLSLDFCLGFSRQAQALEVIYAGVIPMTAGMALAAGLSAFACGSWRGWRNNFYSTLTLSFVCFGAAFGVIAVTALQNARHLTGSALRDAVRKLENDSDTQIGYMLHCNAVAIADNIHTTRKLSIEKMQQLADDYDVDELNILDREGRLLATNNRKVLEFNRQPRRADHLKPYFELLNGSRKFVKEKKFRLNRSDRKTYTKYIGVPMPDGKAFLQLGYTWKRFEEQFETFFFPLLADAEFGGMGYFLIAGPDDRVKVPVNGYPGAVGRTLTELGFRSRDLKEKQNVPFYARINEAWCKCIRYEDVGKWKIYAVQPLAEYYAPAVETVIVAGLLLFALCIIFRLLILKFRSAQRKIDALREAEARRQEEDLALARRIQLSQLREGIFETADYRVNAVMTPAREVGGDFYDYFELEDGRLAIVVADVSGKGIPAAFFMMHAKAIIKSSIFRSASPAEAAGMANQRLNHNNDAYMFVTAWLGIYDSQTGVLEYVSAGHNPAVIKRADGSTEWAEHPRAMALGAFPNAKYTGKTARLQPGDTLILYTDGVTEAMDPAGSLYGADRLISCVSQAVPPVIPAVEADLKKYIDGAAQTDDITMITLERKEP